MLSDVSGSEIVQVYIVLVKCMVYGVVNRYIWMYKREFARVDPDCRATDRSLTRITEARFVEFFRRLKENVKIYPGRNNLAHVQRVSAKHETVDR